MKNLLKLGKILSKVEQKQIFGGRNYLTDCNGGGGDFENPIDCTGGNTDPNICTSNEDCNGAYIFNPFGEDEWIEGYCQITAGGQGVCVLG